jgi:hypothetical protein
MDVVRDLDRLRADERRLRHRLRTMARDDPERTRVDAALVANRESAAALVARREEEDNAL